MLLLDELLLIIKQILLHINTIRGHFCNLFVPLSNKTYGKIQKQEKNLCELSLFFVSGSNGYNPQVTRDVTMF
jgi:hypothetical protein